MHNTNHHAPVPQIQTQQLAHHIQRRFRRVVRVVPPAFFGVSQGYGAGFGGYEEDSGIAGEETGVGEGVD